MTAAIKWTVYLLLAMAGTVASREIHEPGRRTKSAITYGPHTAIRPNTGDKCDKKLDLTA